MNSIYQKSSKGLPRCSDYRQT